SHPLPPTTLFRSETGTCPQREPCVATPSPIIETTQQRAFLRPTPHALYFLAMLSVTFLGTSAARPTVERNVSAVALQRGGETLLFECGEGTQRQMMRFGVSFALSAIFFTH